MTVYQMVQCGTGRPRGAPSVRWSTTPTGCEDTTYAPTGVTYELAPGEHLAAGQIVRADYGPAREEHDE